MRARFNKLISGVLNGNLPSRGYQRWEVQVLLDAQGVEFGSRRKRTILLRRYQKAVDSELAEGRTRPMLFSEFVARVARDDAATLKT